MNNLKLIVLFSAFLFFLCVSEAQNNRGFVLCTWNIGHFSKGKKPYSLIKGTNFRSTLNELQNFIETSACADVLCVNEYNEVFGVDENGQNRITKDLVFSKYKYAEIGPLMGFSSNAIFSNYKIKNLKLCKFMISETLSANLPRADNYYFLECDLVVDKVKIKLVCAHTISSASAASQSMISEILNRYRNNEKVILCGDWNTQDFFLFKNSGYIVGNDGSMKTYPSKNYAFDNIAVKGLVMSEVKMIKIGISDHYPLVCRISLTE